MTMSNIRISINSYTVTYALRETSAPRNYDGFGTITLVDTGDRRIVGIHVEHLDWQTTRYGSGLFGTREVTLDEESACETVFVDRVTSDGSLT
jgi:hypothetical protein